MSGSTTASKIAPDSVSSRSISSGSSVCGGDDAHSEEQVWQQFVTASGGVGSFSLEEGMYYYVSGLAPGSGVSTFPGGLESVYSWFSRSAVHVASLRSRDRDYAMSLAIDRYNCLNVELVAMRKAVVANAGLVQAGVGTRALVEVADTLLAWASDMATERTTCGRIIELLAVNEYEVSKFSEIPNMEAERYSFYDGLIKRKLRKVVVPVEDYVAGLERNVASHKVLSSSRGVCEVSRQYESRRVSRNSGTRKVLEIDMPRWTGIKVMELDIRSGGKRGYRVEEVTVIPGKVVSSFMREESRSYRAGTRERRLSDGTVEVTRY